MIGEDFVDFRELCRECGASFAIDHLERAADGFRVHLAVENTGEHGRLKLVFDANRAFALTAGEAASWIRSYPRVWAQGRTLIEIQKVTKRVFALHPVEGSGLPVEISVGERWDGWFESVRRPLPEEIVALLFTFLPIQQERPKRALALLSQDRTRPFVGLKGEVTVKPPSAFRLLGFRLVASLRSQWIGLRSLESLSGMGGVALGFFGGDLFLGAEGSIVGAVVGLLGGTALVQVGRVYWRDRGSRRVR